MTWSPGDRCLIAKGGLRGQCGTVIRLMAVKVLVKADTGKQAALMPSSLMPIEQPPPPPKPKAPPPEPDDADVELFPDIPPAKPRERRKRRKRSPTTPGAFESKADATPPPGARKGWKRYVRRSHRGHELEARLVRQGDRVDRGFGMVDDGIPGNMLCRNPQNDHRWQMSVEAFNDLYVEEQGKR